MKLTSIIATILFIQDGVSHTQSVDYLEKAPQECLSLGEIKPAFEQIDPKNAWIDIPTSQYALPDDAIFTDIKHMIDTYHTINHLDACLLSHRIETLENILHSIQRVDLTHFEHLQKKSRKFESLTKKRIWYLKEIQSLYADSFTYQPYADVSRMQENDTPVILVNSLAFDPNLPMYWGLFLLEAIDPCHRFLTQYYVKWHAHYQHIPFFVWLEDQEMLFNTFQITYFNPSEMERCKLNVIDGSFYNAVDGSLAHFNTDDKEYLFSISLDKELFVVEGSTYVRHTTLSGGKPSLGSGTLKIKNGTLTYIDTESGHYQPSPYLLNRVFDIFKEKGLALDYDAIQVKYYTSSGVVYESATQFLTHHFSKETTIDAMLKRIDNLFKLKI